MGQPQYPENLLVHQVGNVLWLQVRPIVCQKGKLVIFLSTIWHICRQIHLRILIYPERAAQGVYHHSMVYISYIPLRGISCPAAISWVLLTYDLVHFRSSSYQLGVVDLWPCLFQVQYLSAGRSWPMTLSISGPVAICWV